MHRRRSMDLSAFSSLPPRARSWMNQGVGHFQAVDLGHHGPKPRLSHLQGLSDANSIAANADATVKSVMSTFAQAQSTVGSDPNGKNALGVIKSALDKWAGDHRQWAATGKKATTGSDYSWEDWAKEGAGFAKDAADVAGFTADTSFTSIVWDTVKATAGDVAKIGTNVAKGVVAISNVSAWLPYAAVGGGALLALIIYSKAKKAKRLLT